MSHAVPYCHAAVASLKRVVQLRSRDARLLRHQPPPHPALPCRCPASPARSFLPHVGRVTILMNDYPMFKYALIAVLGVFVLTSKE